MKWYFLLHFFKFSALNIDKLALKIGDKMTNLSPIFSANLSIFSAENLKKCDRKYHFIANLLLNYSV